MRTLLSFHSARDNSQCDLRSPAQRRIGESTDYSERGTPLDADNFRHWEFPEALRRAELRRIRFHDLRHTYTTLLIAHGAHPKYIQAQLGHASIQTTLDRYGHLMPQLHQAEAQKLDQLVFGQEAPRRRRADSRRYALAGPCVGAKREQSLFLRNGVGAKREQKTRRVSDVIANPSYCLVAGAGFEPAIFGL